MALTKEQLKKYSLSESNAKSADHDKGIVEVQGQYYSIDGFERQQRDDIDTDQGAVFSSSLEKDSNKDFTNFNTATDVEGALNSLFDDEEEPETPVEQATVVLSDRLQGARTRLAQREEDLRDGTVISNLYDRSKTKNTPAQNFLGEYMNDLGDKLRSGFYINPEDSKENK